MNKFVIVSLVVIFLRYFVWEKKCWEEGESVENMDKALRRRRTTRTHKHRRWRSQMWAFRAALRPRKHCTRPILHALHSTALNPAFCSLLDTFTSGAALINTPSYTDPSPVFAFPSETRPLFPRCQRVTPFAELLVSAWDIEQCFSSGRPLQTNSSAPTRSLSLSRLAWSMYCSTVFCLTGNWGMCRESLRSSLFSVLRCSSHAANIMRLFLALSLSSTFATTWARMQDMSYSQKLFLSSSRYVLSLLFSRCGLLTQYSVLSQGLLQNQRTDGNCIFFLCFPRAKTSRQVLLTMKASRLLVHSARLSHSSASCSYQSSRSSSKNSQSIDWCVNHSKSAQFLLQQNSFLSATPLHSS